MQSVLRPLIIVLLLLAGMSVGQSLSAPPVPIVWTSDNDGAGSGLDADTLDGVDSAAFLDAVNDTANTFGAALQAETDARVAGDAALSSGIDALRSDVPGMAWSAVLARDGSGSTLDADTLDGLHAAAFLSAGGKAVDADKLDGLDSGNFLRVTGKAADADRLDGYDSSSFLSWDGTAANSHRLGGYDAGSFLKANSKAVDADRLDGLDSSAFAQATHLHDDRYFTEAESEAYFLNAGGDAMDGPLTMRAHAYYRNSHAAQFGFDATNLRGRIMADSIDLNAYFSGGNNRLYIGGNSRVTGDFSVIGAKSFIQEHPDRPDAALLYYSLESPRSDVYWRGEGRLVDGVAQVTLPEEFRLLASGTPSLVLTPLGDTPGLYAPKARLGFGGFEVREIGGGRGNVEFSYVIYGERAGFEDATRLVEIGIKDKIGLSRSLTQEERNALFAALPADPGRVPAVAQAAILQALHEGRAEDALAALRALG